jgi:hypothetical protein
MLQRLMYTGDFISKGTRYAGSHEPLITRARFEDVQACSAASLDDATRSSGMRSWAS